MESNNEKQVVDLYAAAQKLAFFLRGKVHTDNMVVRQLPNTGINAQALTTENCLSLEQAQCWWVPSIDGAIAVLVAPMRYVWHIKYGAQLELPVWSPGLRTVWFAHLNSTGIPVPVSHFGIVPNTWNLKTPIKIIHLEEGESNAIQRAQHNWGQIAFSCWAATLLDTATVIHEKLKTPADAG
jgi:hypothetical protein